MPTEVTADDLKTALKRHEFFLEYQPQPAIEGGAVSSFEALVRLRRDGRIVPPAEFIPLAEQTGFIRPLGRWVLEAACKQAAKWEQDLSVAVNLSAVQLADEDTERQVERALALAGLDGSRLMVEVTETALVTQPQRAETLLRNMQRRFEVAVAIDDFGVGYSSMLYLRRFPAQQIKIDRSFIAGTGLNRQDSAIARCVVDLAHALGLEALAEGVETAAQVGALVAIGCDTGQGFYWAKPMPAEAVEFYLLNPDGKTEAPA